MDHIEIRFGEHIETPARQEKSFEELFQSVNPMFCFSKRVWKPQMDIFETREQIIIQAEMAGVKREDIVIEISPRAVKISGQRRCTQPDPEATYRLAEIQFGHFERVLHLPHDIDMKNVSASFSRGFLELRLGKYQDKHVEQKRNLSMDFF